MTEKRLPPPPRLAGFDYIRPLGAGGFAAVYLYEQDLPRRPVAVKVLTGELRHARDRSDFEAEADAMARISNHPSIVSVHAAGIAADGRPYLVMEYCPGSMRERTRGAPAPLEAVLDAGVRLAGALETAHRSGILHRDIKPSNVLITATGRPALTDFGIATLRGRAASDERSRAMSIPWAAPEVLTGETPGSVAGEIWSLGATLYTFAAGHSPFALPEAERNTRRAITARIVRARYRPVPGASGYQPFDAQLARAMAREPKDRFASMREFGESLQHLQRGYGFDVTPLDLADPPAIPVAPLPAAPRPAAPRGPVGARLRATTRVERRAMLGSGAKEGAGAPDRDGIAPDAPTSPLRAGLLGAAIAAVLVGGLAALAIAQGWIG
ncbi:MAG: serine/threonine protein kinase [Leucobacter sp.]|nr:serine/threonine protein kinase [Leucobacter sp.]